MILLISMVAVLIDSIGEDSNFNICLFFIYISSYSHRGSNNMVEII